MWVSQTVPGGDLRREVDAIERALADRDGPTDRRELARVVGARFWGPGRFGWVERLGASRALVRQGGERWISVRP
jgi:hypothetical protein